MTVANRLNDNFRRREQEKKEKNKGPKDKKKGKYYNYDKKGHFAADCYLKKNSTITPKPKEKVKKLKPKDKRKEKITTNAITRTQQ
jgi:hypothetical protein